MNDEIRNTVCDFGNLYKALYKCKHNVMWKDSVAGFVKNGLVNCYKLKHQLDTDTYKIDPYAMFTIYEPKKREIVSTRIKDRVFQRSLCDNYLYPMVSKSFIYGNSACQDDKGTDFGRKQLHCYMQRHYRKHGLSGYVLKCDLSNYFGSTAHRIAIAAIDQRTPNGWAVERVCQIIRSFSQGENPDVGMGLGSQVTQLIELAVLDDLDHYIKEQLHIRGYVRYMDDFILLHPDKAYLIECREKINERISLLGLTLSPHKTQLFPISQPIRFLGYSFRLTDTGKVVRKMLPEKVTHERRKLKRLVNRAKAGKMTKSEVDACYTGWRNSHASYGDNHNLVLAMDKFYKELWR